MYIKIKSKEQMKKDKVDWNHETNSPYNWNPYGEMDYLYNRIVKVTKKYKYGFSIQNEKRRDREWLLDNNQVQRILTDEEMKRNYPEYLL